MGRRPIAAVAAVALTTQVVSAAWIVKPYPMPNASLIIAYNVASTGRYEGGSWARLKGTVVPSDPPLRSYHLPGEPLYLAAGLVLGRPFFFQYWHVPVAMLLIVVVAATAQILFGPTVALLAGLIAALDPLMLVHGPVYDDAFLGAALLWLVGAAAISRWMTAARPTARPAGLRAAIASLVLIVAAAWGAVTRTEVTLALLGMSLCCLLVPSLRPMRRPGMLIFAGVVIGVTAWTARNVVIQHHVLVGSTHDGLTLWESTAPQATEAISLGQVDALSSEPAVMTPLWAQTIGADEVGANRIFFAAAIRDIAAQPVRVAALAVRKVALSVAGIRPELPVSSPRNVVSILVMILLCLAAARGRRRAATGGQRPRAPVIAAYVLGLELVIVLALGPVGLRYWIAWRPVLWILAACGVASWPERPSPNSVGAVST
jgi:hypothetical protein